MSLTPNDFDPLAVIADWLDACRSGDPAAVLDLYDDGARLDCDCEGVSLVGRASLSAYWDSKLRDQLPTAFTLDGLAATVDGVWFDYRDEEGKPVRAHFRFSAAGRYFIRVAGRGAVRLSA
jgi:hypothetical protein